MESLNIEHSRVLLERAHGLIPASTQTLAKGPGQYVRGFAPSYAKGGKGGRITDVDGNEYVDLSMAIGPISLGYGHADVDNAIREQLADGITFSLMHPLEVEVAELIRDVVPNVESVRYSKTGCDVTSAAVRLARAFTGRSEIVCCGYHGWHDWYIGTTDRGMGIPGSTREMTFTFDYNDIDSLLEAISSDTAAVIMEPMVFDLPENDFLQRVRDVCDNQGILLIFDEMWTGFRLALGGAQEYFNVRADLVCFSKAIANGMPLSVLAGRSDVMQLLERDVFFFTTFGGEALSLAAAKATIEVIRDRDVPSVIATKGAALQAQVHAILASVGIDYLTCKGHPARTMMSFTGSDALLMKSYVQQEMLRRGVLWGGFHTMCLDHTLDDLSVVVSAYREVLPLLHDAVRTGTLAERLQGDPLEVVFRKTERFNSKPRGVPA